MHANSLIRLLDERNDRQLCDLFNSSFSRLSLNESPGSLHENSTGESGQGF